jgi:hypothetical protein
MQLFPHKLRRIGSDSLSLINVRWSILDGRDNRNDLEKKCSGDVMTQIKVVPDHAAITLLLTYTRLNPRRASWSKFLVAKSFK